VVGQYADHGLRSGRRSIGWFTLDADGTVLGVVTILVDDLRSFEVIRDLGDAFVHELWLDHDLGGDDTIRP